MCDSPELKTIKKCAPDLETTLSGLEREFIHFLAQEGFISDQVSGDVLDPRSILTDEQKAGLLVQGIKRRVQLDANSYHILLEHFKNGGNLYKPIVRKLEQAYSEIIHRNGQSTPCGSQSHAGQGKYYSLHRLQLFWIAIRYHDHTHRTHPQILTTPIKINGASCVDYHQKMQNQC